MIRWNLPLTVTSLCWGFNFVALKQLYPEMPPNVVSLVRFALMYAILVSVCLATKRPLKFPPGKAFQILTLGFFSMGVYMIFFLEGMRGTTAAEGSIVLATSPIFTMLGAVVIRQEKFRPAMLIGALVAISGVGMLVFAGDSKAHGSLWGNGMVLLSALIWAGCALATRSLVKDLDPVRLLTLSMPGGLLALIPFGAADLLSFSFAQMTANGWLMLAHISVLAGVAAFIGFFVGVQQIGAGAAMLYQYFVPGLSILFAWLVLGQGMQPLQYVGFAVVLAGVVYAQRRPTAQATAP